MAKFNEENIQKILNSRIPLPVGPLPPLPKHLLARKTVLGDKRRPLETLMQSNAVPTTSDDRTIEQKPLVLDTRYVTFRRRDVDLDRDYKVFKDQREDDVSSVSDDSNSNENSEVKINENNREKNCHGDPGSALTPAKSLLEPIRAELERDYKVFKDQREDDVLSVNDDSNSNENSEVKFNENNKENNCHGDPGSALTPAKSLLEPIRAELDRDYKVFKDQREDDVLSVSDDSNSNENSEVKFNENNKEKNCHGDPGSALTPAKSLLEPIRAELDRDYKVFKDQREDDVLSVSDDSNSNENSEVKFNENNKEKNCHGDPGSALTPAKSLLEPIRAELDRDYKVFKDQREDDVLSVSDDSNSNENSEVKFNENNKEKNCHGDPGSALTPAKSLLEPIRAELDRDYKVFKDQREDDVLSVSDDSNSNENSEVKFNENNKEKNCHGDPGSALTPAKSLLEPIRAELDRDYKVFKDQREDDVLSVSDDSNSNENSEVKFNENNKEKNCHGDPGSALTPAKSLLEPKGERNIKKSLTRPHSTELQGLSTAPKHGKVDEGVKRKLQFCEPLEDRLASPDFLKKSYMECMKRDYTDDIFEYLLTVEKKPLGIPHLQSITRAGVINWLIEVNGPDGNPALVQSACWYLDSFLGNVEIHLKDLQLVGAACYWISQKLHGSVMTSKELIKCSKNAFSAEPLKRAEKHILKTLNFPAQPVVPQDFINYLSWWCDNKHPGEIEVAATILCLSGLMVSKTFGQEYPSVIAAASVRNALVLLKKCDLMTQLQMCPLYKAAQKKTSDFIIGIACSTLRRAIRTISAPTYEYKAPLEHYNLPPYFLAQKIINSANVQTDVDCIVLE